MSSRARLQRNEILPDGPPPPFFSVDRWVGGPPPSMDSLWGAVAACLLCELHGIFVLHLVVTLWREEAAASIFLGACQYAVCIMMLYPYVSVETERLWREQGCLTLATLVRRTTGWLETGKMLLSAAVLFGLAVLLVCGFPIAPGPGPAPNPVILAAVQALAWGKAHWACLLIAAPTDAPPKGKVREVDAVVLVSVILLVAAGICLGLVSFGTTAGYFLAGVASCALMYLLAASLFIGEAVGAPEAQQAKATPNETVRAETRVEQLGGIEQARQALATLEELR